MRGPQNYIDLNSEAARYAPGGAQASAATEEHVQLTYLQYLLLLICKALEASRASGVARTAVSREDHFYEDPFVSDLLRNPLLVLVQRYLDHFRR
jgi:hypothetical protein